MTPVVLFAVLLMTAAPVDDKSVNEKLPTLAEVIANIAAHEKTLHDMDAKWRVKWKLTKEDFGFSGAITQRTSTRSCVVQGELFRFELKAEGETNANTEHKVHRLYTYDGSKTKSKADDIINVQDSVVHYKSYAFRPYCVLQEESGVEVPLSVWLKGGEELKTHPDASYFKSVYSVKSSLVGYETFQGIRCLKLKVTSSANKKSWSNGEDLIWISPKHNYLPIRQEGFIPSASKTVPVTVGEVLKFKELKEGIWLPALWKHTVYSDLEIKKSGTKIELGTYEGILDSFDLHPKYDVEFFQKVD